MNFCYLLFIPGMSPEFGINYSCDKKQIKVMYLTSKTPVLAGKKKRKKERKVARGTKILLRNNNQSQGTTNT